MARKSFDPSYIAFFWRRKLCHLCQTYYCQTNMDNVEFILGYPDKPMLRGHLSGFEPHKSRCVAHMITPPCCSSSIYYMSDQNREARRWVGLQCLHSLKQPRKVLNNLGTNRSLYVQQKLILKKTVTGINCDQVAAETTGPWQRGPKPMECHYFRRETNSIWHGFAWEQVNFKAHGPNGFSTFPTIRWHKTELFQENLILGQTQGPEQHAWVV